MDIRESIAHGLGLRRNFVTESKAVQKLDEKDIVAIERIRKSPLFESVKKQGYDYHALRAVLCHETTEPISMIEARAKRIAVLIREGKISADLNVSRKSLIEAEGGMGDPMLGDGQEALGAAPDIKKPKSKDAEVPDGKSYAEESRRRAARLKEKQRRLREEEGGDGGSPLKPETPGVGDAGFEKLSPTKQSNAVDVKEAEDEVPPPQFGDGSMEEDDAGATPDAADVADGQGATDMGEDADMPPPPVNTPASMSEDGDTDDLGNPIDQDMQEDGEGADEFGNPAEPMQEDGDEDDPDMQVESVMKRLKKIREARKGRVKESGSAIAPPEAPEADDAIDYKSLDATKGVEDYNQGKGQIEARRRARAKRLREEEEGKGGSPLKPETPGVGDAGKAKTSPVEDPDSVEVKERYKGLTRTERCAVLYLRKARIAEGTRQWREGFKRYVKHVGANEAKRPAPRTR